MYSEIMKSRKTIPICFLALAVAVSCGTARKEAQLRERMVSASLALPDSYSGRLPDIGIPEVRQNEVAREEEDGRDVIVMNALRDEASGEMVANETLEAARVTARFRNVAERHGRVDLAFQIIVPSSMQDSRWQVRFHPTMEMLGEVIPIDDIFITGKEYRKAQLRGYQQYERFLRSIVTDSTRFIDMHQLEIFIQRNIPDLYALRRDSSAVSDEKFASIYGVTERDAVEYYTYGVLARRNERRIRDKDKMFRRYVKAPLQHERLRLDTVMVNGAGDLVYDYVQTIDTRPALRKVDIRLSGEVCEQDRVVYRAPESDPLTFYISSLSSFVDGRNRYLDRVISRRVDRQEEAYLIFPVGDDSVREDLGENGLEICRIKSALDALLDNREFDLDSIVVTANASPEGNYRSNGDLSVRRGRSVGRYFGAYMRRYADSTGKPVPYIPFINHFVPENWEGLDSMVGKDRFLTDEQKARYRELRDEPDPDRREAALRGEESYPYLLEVIYPQLRSVVFHFRLHRRDMVKDTVHTTVLDSAYMAGVDAIRDRDYKLALDLLRPYEDYNTAIAYCCLDYNRRALSILETEPESPEVNYLLALLYSREGDDRKALEFYRAACTGDRTFVHRGNLDPEISGLIRKYGLNRDDN